MQDNTIYGWTLRSFKGLGKGHDLATLQEATKNAHDLAPSFKTRFQPRDSHTMKDKDKDKKPFY